MILKVNDRFVNRKVDYFNEFTLHLAYNSVASSFGFRFYFDPYNERHKELACVSHYHGVQVEEQGELLLTGTIVDQDFGQASQKEMTTFSGYSRPGVLEDCEIPPNLSLQADGLSLKQIAQRVLKPFKIDMIIDDAVASKMSKSFDVSAASDSATVKSYLTDLAKQKDIIIGHDELGRLLFTEAKTTLSPILDFDLTKGSIPGIKFRFKFGGQGIHSHITMRKQAGIDGGNAGEQTLRNPYVVGSSAYRPTVKTQSSGDDNDTSLAVRRALANELREIRLTITMDRWIIDGKIIRPNNVITIFAPELYIYKKTTFFIESIDYTGNQKSTTAVLNCVLPEVYTNQVPVSIFAGINLYAKPHV